jgi:hypothetical protein
MQSIVKPSTRHVATRTLVLMAGLIAALLISSAAGLTATARASEPAAAPAATPKAVIIVGPTHGSTANFLAEGELFANQAEAAGMAVVRVFHPRATWKRVRDLSQDANLVVYFGHGNGWPSPYAPFQEDTKNGFGLNAVEGGSSSSVTYYGGNKIRAGMRLAPGAVVILYRACYAAGIGEAHLPVPSKSLALERVDNFAAGFLDESVGAAAVFAFWTKQWIDLAGELMTSGQTMEDIIRTPSAMPGWPASGWGGTNPAYGDSDRTPGARMLLDHHSTKSYSRAVSGNLDMTTDAWLAEDPSDGSAPDEEAPELTNLAGVPAADTFTAGDDALPTFTPNGDGLSDRLTITHTVSEPAHLDFRVRSMETDDLVDSFTVWTEGGPGATTWNGKDSSGAVVPDGRYLIAVTPTDRAGNVGDSRNTRARVFTALKSPGAAPAFFFARDGDDLAATTTLRVTLTRPTILDWRIVDADGATVRTLVDEEAREVGLVERVWDGRDDVGEYVPDAVYSQLATATTEAGSYSHELAVRVMPFKLMAPRWSGPAGTTVTFTMKSAEHLTGWPVITVKQPGLAKYRAYVTRWSTKKFKFTVTFKSGGQPGDAKIKIVGTDSAGGKQLQNYFFAVR